MSLISTRDGHYCHSTEQVSCTCCNLVIKIFQFEFNSKFHFVCCSSRMNWKMFTCNQEGWEHHSVQKKKKKDIGNMMITTLCILISKWMESENVRSVLYKQWNNGKFRLWTHPPCMFHLVFRLGIFLYELPLMSRNESKCLHTSQHEQLHTYKWTQLSFYVLSLCATYKDPHLANFCLFRCREFNESMVILYTNV